MRKAMCILLSAALAALPAGCGRESAAPFRTGEVRSVEIYRYDGVPAGAEKKTVTDPAEIARICERLLAAGTPQDGEPLAGGTVISFRVQLEDAAPYEAVYEETAEENSLREMEALWDGLSGEAAPASQEELPS